MIQTVDQRLEVCVGIVRFVFDVGDVDGDNRAHVLAFGDVILIIVVRECGRGKENRPERQKTQQFFQRILHFPLLHYSTTRAEVQVNTR